MTIDITLYAIKMATGRRIPEEGLIFHSYRGGQYTVNAYRGFLKDNGVAQSMN